jgi:hypothetical protein
MLSSPCRYGTRPGAARVAASKTRAIASMLGAIASMLGVVVVSLGCPALAGALPDGRAVELVTPVEASGAGPGSAVPAPDGEAVDFQATPFGDAAGGESTLYQARRSASGWQTTALTPKDVVQAKPLSHTAPMFFTPDLGLSIFATEQPLSGGGGGTGALNLYAQSSQAPRALTLLSQGSQVGAGLASATFDAATPDGDFVAFDSAEPLISAATGLQESGYQTDDYLYVRDVAAGSTQLVDVDDEGALLDPEGAVLGNGSDLVAGEPSAPGEASPFTYLPADGAGGTTTHAISADGTKVFFESPTPAADEVELVTHRDRQVHLYMRKDATTTVQLDQGGAGGGEEEAGARYLGASEDGSKVFFVSDEALAGDEFKDTELYEYDTQSEKLTAVSVAPQGTPAVDGAVRGVAAIANDGSRVYYVAAGKLASNENQLGQGAEEGQPNLYVYDTATAINTFVAQLAPEDIEGEPGSAHAAGLASYLDVERPAVPTPDGEVLVFDSHRDLTGEARGAAQVYRYDAASGALDCLSCAPGAAGAASIGVIPVGAGGPIGGGSYDPPGQSAPMSADGERVFFETESSLVGEDENGGAPPIQVGSGESAQQVPQNIDVYEWENGHVHLLSAGRPGLTRLQGVTPSGNDALFTSSVSLTEGAPAGYVSLYDARVAGGFPATPRSESASCESVEGCQGPLGEPAPLAIPGTSTLADVSTPAPATPARHKKATGKRKQTQRTGKDRHPRSGKRHAALHRAASRGKIHGRGAR